MSHVLDSVCCYGWNYTYALWYCTLLPSMTRMHCNLRPPDVVHHHHTTFVVRLLQTNVRT